MELDLIAEVAECLVRQTRSDSRTGGLVPGGKSNRMFMCRRADVDPLQVRSSANIRRFSRACTPAGANANGAAATIIAAKAQQSATCAWPRRQQE